MFKYLFLIFIVVPLLELYILIEVGGAIGALTTILVIIATAALGGWLMKYQGIQLMRQTQRQLAQGQLPQRAALEGALIFIGGIILLLPGLVTDLMGLMLLIPAIRVAVVRTWAQRAGQRRASQNYHYTVDTEWQSRDPVTGQVEYHHLHQETPIKPTKTTREGDTIEGEWRDDESKKP